MVQNAPENVCEKVVIAPPTPNFNIALRSSPGATDRSSQVTANIECNVSPRHDPANMTCKFENTNNPEEDDVFSQTYTSSAFDKSMQSPVISEQISYTDEKETTSLANTSFDALELNIQEVLALDVEHSAQRLRNYSGQSSKTDNRNKNKSIFKSLPNLSASSENLLV